ncbi:hypothetical protein GO988_16230 [Hymenobacter sp. HMF4947]|uniref:DUF2306 domain-containing protein n=1 Tax=Hymenobacter ginkgonis TaxID=2682976 RepID=A0A7K1THJ7_9BACT|nr:hypothetical protein [Hymenobacter ginkgonis]MVN77879.1 hypothetical protein [Hymenobacter ginkgonis]
MATLLLYLRYLHILAGFIGFFVAPVALAVRKGGVAHRRWGQVFFWAMVVAGITSLLLAGLQLLFVSLPAGRSVALLFLLLTGLFSLYLAIFGYRALYLKRLGQGQRPTLADWLLAGVGLPVFGFFVFYGSSHQVVPAIVFGTAGVVRAGTQLWSYLRSTPPRPGQWLRNHISGFMGAYIAAVSAFSATSLHFIPWPWNFLWPSIIGVPYMLWAQRRYVGATGTKTERLAPTARSAA